MGLPGPTWAGVGLDGAGLVVAEWLARAPLAPPLDGQNCQAATRNATTKAAALPLRHASCRREGRRGDAGLRYGPGGCCIARSLAADFRHREGIGEPSQPIQEIPFPRIRGQVPELQRIIGVAV